MGGFGVAVCLGVGVGVGFGFGVAVAVAVGFGFGFGFAVARVRGRTVGSTSVAVDETLSATSVQFVFSDPTDAEGDVDGVGRPRFTFDWSLLPVTKIDPATPILCPSSDDSSEDAFRSAVSNCVSVSQKTLTLSPALTPHLSCNGPETLSSVMRMTPCWVARALLPAPDVPLGPDASGDGVTETPASAT